MERTTRYAEIPAIKKGVAFSDPSYDESVWCQYRHEFQATDWLMKMDASRDEDGYLDFALSIGRRTIMSSLSIREEAGNTSIAYPAHYGASSKEIGIDTACVFVGSFQNFMDFGESASIYTASDGLFGNLYIFTVNGEKDPAGFLLMGAVDEDITSGDDLFRTILSSFDGQEIDRGKYEELTDREDLGLRMLFAKEMSGARALGGNERAQDESRNAGKER